MATKKAGGTAKNLTDSNPQYLGVKLYAGEKAHPGSVIIRQRGTRMLPGQNVGMGKDHTLYALTEGIVSFGQRRKTGFNQIMKVKKMVHVTGEAPTKTIAKTTLKKPTKVKAAK